MTLSTWLLVLVAAGPFVAPEQDDAAFLDVQWLGPRKAFAVGTFGAVWRTEDSGLTWQPMVSPDAKLTLHSVAFISDQFGWVGGAELQPYVGLAVGRIYRTTDGGQSWQACGDRPLPAVRSLRMFTPEEGLAVCEPSPSAPTGVFRTEDGGITWTPVPGPVSGSPTAAAIASPEMGLIVGSDGRLALVTDEQIFPSKLPSLGSRTVRGVTLSGDETGWLVGDQGLVMTSATGGVTWQSPPTPLPPDLRHVANFHSVERKGAHVWIAGAPGSVIWHSPDAGKTWEPQPTDSALPVHRVRFANETLGLAVGELGSVLRTDDSGRTWKTVRGRDRRLAVLSIPARVTQTPLELATQAASENGYRLATWMPLRTETRKDGPSLDEALAAAMSLTGGSSGVIDSRLPVDLPGLERDANRLLNRWQQRSEGRVGPVLIGGIVQQLRMWRPEVVVVPEPAADDAAGQYLLQAVQLAVKEAADPTRYLEQRELGGLQPWTTPRVFLHLPEGSQGAVRIDPATLLPRRESTVQLATAPARSLTGSVGMLGSTFRQIHPPVIDQAIAGDLFQGLNLAPGTPTRRTLAPLDDTHLARTQQRLQKLKNFQALVTATKHQPAMGAQWLGQLPDLLRSSPSSEAAAVLSDLANGYREQGQYESAEAAYLDLVRRHPDSPAALQAMRWLLQYWTSSEVAWMRQRERVTTGGALTTDPTNLPGQLQQAGGSGFLSAPRSAQDIIMTRAETTSNRTLNDRAVRGIPGLSSPEQAAELARSRQPDSVQGWRTRAAELAQQLESQAPALFERPEIQFPLAALKRARGSAGQADVLYRKFQTTSPDETLQLVAAQELWLGRPVGETPKRFVPCRFTQQRPQLDGLLSDPCWRDAVELKLGTVDEPGGFAMVAYDREFLYVAATCPRKPGADIVLPASSDRQHDADVAAQDRLIFALDADRDYATWYEFQVDQRGETHDRCWEETRWNPKWFVAVTGDDTAWRMEVAIPWEPLTPTPPEPRQAWGFSLVRVTPGVGVDGWDGPSAWPLRGIDFGLLRFE